MLQMPFSEDYACVASIPFRDKKSNPRILSNLFQESDEDH